MSRGRRFSKSPSRPFPSTHSPAKESKKPAQEAGFLLRVFSRERRYADLGYLLPMFPIGPAVKPGVSALPLGTLST